MKQIVLIRHAKSSQGDVSLDDIDRPLNNRGKREAVMLGQLLKKNNIFPQFVISSPAKRARKTAIRIVKELNFPKENIEINDKIYAGNIAEMTQIICSLDKKINQVFIIGHNPSLMDLGNYLAASSIEKLPTCGFMLIKFNCKFWEDISAGSGILDLVGSVE